MSRSTKGVLTTVKNVILNAKDWILDHKKIAMPVFLVICVGLTVLIAVNANHKAALEQAAQEATESPDTSQEIMDTPVYELEENAYPEVNDLIKKYYDAQCSGDMETISALNSYLNDIEKIRVEELSKYIEAYPVLNVYTKPGYAEGTYVAYVCTEVKFVDLDTTIPGMQTYYIGTKEDGSLFINDGTYDDDVYNYIKNITLQDDVVDLNNKIVVSYNDLLAENSEVSEFVAYLKEKINEDVGVILAQADAPKEQMIEEALNEQEDAEAPKEGSASKDALVKTTAVVNVRVSDSQLSDSIGKAALGQELPLLEQKGNGWSKVLFEGREAYIKSEYLELVQGSVGGVSAVTEETQEEEVAEASDSDVKSVTVKKDKVRIREQANTDCEILATVSKGTKLEVTGKSGQWYQVTYQGKTGYIREDFVE